MCGTRRPASAPATLSELPGNVVLPSGEYVMKLLDSPGDRHVVQVFNKEQNHVYATVHAIPTQRQHPAEHITIALYETPADQPMFIRHWFYPGDTIGQVFVFSKDRAKYMANLSGSAVPATDGERQLRERPTSEAAAMTQQAPERQPQQVAQATPLVREQPRDEPRAQPTDDPAEPEPAPAPEPEPSSQPSPQAKPQSNTAAEAQRTTQRDVLPETAGVGVGVGFIGISLLAAAATLRATRNRKP